MRLALLLLFAACAAPQENVRSVQNVGSISVLPAEAGAPLVFQYWGPCLSGSCTSDLVAACDAQLDGSNIRLSTHAEWIDHTEEYGACTRDCAIFSTKCATSHGVAAGTYTAMFGDSTTELTIPINDLEVIFSDRL